MVPEGMISEEEVPNGWGLLYVGKGVVIKKHPNRFQSRNIMGEMEMLISALIKNQGKGYQLQPFIPNG